MSNQSKLPRTDTLHPLNVTVEIGWGTQEEGGFVMCTFEGGMPANNATLRLKSEAALFWPSHRPWEKAPVVRIAVSN